MIAASVLQGASVLVAVALLYALVVAAGTAEPQARAMAFAAIVIGNVGLILSNRSRQATLLETLRRPNPALWWIVAGALLGLALALYVEPMLEIFRFAPLSWSQLLMSIAAAAVGLTLPELYKWFRPYSMQPRRASVRTPSN
jgi:Ca2+-transporting ATPase